MSRRVDAEPGLGQAHQADPEVSRFLLGATTLEAVVLAGSGAGLYFLPDVIDDAWPWPLLPFNSRFLGAIYLSALVAVIGMLTTRHWAPARIVLPMILVFTGVVVVVTAAYEDRLFFVDRPGPSWAWVVLYVLLFVNAAYHLWRYRHWYRSDRWPRSPRWRSWLLLEAACLLVFGAGLLIAPSAFGSFWPWAIDDFHARMYSATFLSGAVGLLLLARGGAPVEWRTIGLTQALQGALSVAGVVLVDRTTNRVDWGDPGTWMWLALFAVLCVTGFAMSILRPPSSTAPPPEGGSAR